MLKALPRVSHMTRALVTVECREEGCYVLSPGVLGGDQGVHTDEERAMMESLLGIRRAGADMIITYFATTAARALAAAK